MDDNEIIDLYWRRDENAIHETDRKYRNYLLSVAGNIINNNQDKEEVLNDTYLATWNNIPPDRPFFFRVYLATIIRNKALRKIQTDGRYKNGGKRMLQA